MKFERTTKEIQGEFSTYRLKEPKWTTVPFEGRLAVDFNALAVKEKRTIPVGSVTCR